MNKQQKLSHKIKTVDELLQNLSRRVEALERPMKGLEIEPVEDEWKAYAEKMLDERWEEVSKSNGLRVENTNLRNTVYCRDAEIERLKAENDRLESKNRDVFGALMSSDGERAILQQKINAGNEEFSALGDIVCTLKSKIARFVVLVAELKSEIKAIEELSDERLDGWEAAGKENTILRNRGKWIPVDGWELHDRPVLVRTWHQVDFVGRYDDGYFLRIANKDRFLVHEVTHVAEMPE